jgi:hypothetical protein
MDRAANYQIRVRGGVGPEWSGWLGELTGRQYPDGTTALEGVIADQAALHGVLARIRDLGLELISVVPIDCGGPEHRSREKESDENVY